ncbi:hypothetical protein SAMN05444161_7475 [Rhizobiales bacterium GAS191]|nr:hypothetical protein SAMN05444161_7475 [Rhizobiales bacterium GAS191]
MGAPMSTLRRRVEFAIAVLLLPLSLGAALMVPGAGREAPAFGNLARAQTLATPPMPKPAYLERAADPVFATPFVRVTNPGEQPEPGLGCGSAYCTHRYSSAQAWNADQSLLVIVNGCSGSCFLDGHSYKPLFQRTVPNECEWHPVDPTLMICVDQNEIYLWAPVTDTRTTVYAPSGYKDFQFGPYKGNPSQDGNRLVVRAMTSAGSRVAFAYDISERTKHPDIELAELVGENGYCGISPSGRYIFCWQVMPDETNEAYVFTVEGLQIQHWAENHRPGHGDMTIDVDGEDVYVGISKADPDKYHIIKRRLRDGAATDLAPYGEGQHASLRNTNRPGWVFVTYTGSYPSVAGQQGWAPFYQEVVALRIDGSGEIRRIVQTRDAKYDYWGEAHASPSPDGSQVIWSSNWGQPGGPVADYVALVSWPETQRRETASYR